MSESSEVEVPETPVETPIYIVYPRRFYVLFVFSFLSFNQCMMWLTFSPIERYATVYYNISESTIDLLLNWGPIIFIPCLPLTSLLLNTANGLRYGVLILAVADFIAALIRILPSIILQPTSPNFDKIALPFIHAGQILNAACGPLVMAPVSQISSTWFAPHERTRATTIAILSNSLGSAVAFLISPHIVNEKDHVPRLLYLQFGLAFAACVFTLISFPARPPSPPSAAAELLQTDAIGTEHEHSRRTFLRDILACFKNPSFVLLSTAGGLIYGMFGAWTGLYDYLFQTIGYDETFAGLCGFISTIAAVVGGVVYGALGDLRMFQHSIKLLTVLALVACTLSIVWFELYVPSIFRDTSIFQSTHVTMALVIALAGLFQGAAAPLIYEALAEITYPLHESLSASILVQWINVASLIFLFVAPGREKLVDFLVLVVMVISVLLVLLTRFTYQRRDEDERKRIEKEQILRSENQNINQSINGISDGRQYGTFSRTDLLGDQNDDISTPTDERI